MSCPVTSYSVTSYSVTRYPVKSVTKKDMGVRTWIEIDKSALEHNIAQLRKCSSSLFGVVIKGNAYGHGLQVIAELLEQNTAVDLLCVAGTQEVIALKQAGIRKNIVAMSYIDSDLHDVVRYGVAVGVYTIEAIQELHAVATEHTTQVRVHIKVDTGMSRLGIAPAEMYDFIQKIAPYSTIIVEGIFTHLSDTNAVDDTFSHQQLDLFDYAIAQARRAGFNGTMIHALASGSLYIDREGTREYTHVRVGTNIFGYWKSSVQKERFIAQYPQMELRPVLCWKTRVMHIKTLAVGECVGYNRTFRACGPMVIALLPVGYADGYPRCLSNRSSVVIGGMVAPVLGIVSMNLMAVDITHIPTCVIHDEVMLIGAHSAVSAETVASLCGTISNELLTRICPTINRVAV